MQLKVRTAYQRSVGARSGVITSIDFSILGNATEIHANITLDVTDLSNFKALPEIADLELWLEKALKDRINIIDGEEVSSYDLLIRESEQPSTEVEKETVYYEAAAT
jgi:hypothetical protein